MKSYIVVSAICLSSAVQTLGVAEASTSIDANAAVSVPAFPGFSSGATGSPPFQGFGLTYQIYNEAYTAYGGGTLTAMALMNELENKQTYFHIQNVNNPDDNVRGQSSTWLLRAGLEFLASGLVVLAVVGLHRRRKTAVVVDATHQDSVCLMCAECHAPMVLKRLTTGRIHYRGKFECNSCGHTMTTIIEPTNASDLPLAPVLQADSAEHMATASAVKQNAAAKISSPV
jgi:hypothetical protein